MRLFFAIGLVCVSFSVMAQTQSSALEASCSEKIKTIDFNTGAKGEKLDGFCHGYLVAQFEALQASKAICVKANEMATTEYLWPIAQTYKKEKKGPLPLTAQEFISKSLIHAFPCTKK